MCAASGIPFVKEEIKSSILIRITGRGERGGGGGWMPRETVLCLNADELFPQAKDNH